MKESSADSKDTPSDMHLPAKGVGVGLALAALLIGDLYWGPGTPTVAMLTIVVVAVALAVIAFFWKGVNGVTVVRWWARTVGIVSAIGMASFGLFDGWAAVIVALIRGQGWPASDVPGDLLSVVFVGLLIAFFWEGIGGAIVAFGALAMLVVETIVNADFVNAGWPALYLPIGLVLVGLAFIYCWWRTRLLPSPKATSLRPLTAVHGHGIQPRSWRLIAQLVMVALVIAGLAWQVVLHLQPPPPPPADCGQPADVARSGAVVQFCFLNLTPFFGQGSMTAGPDGSVWFTEGSKIARITPAGTLTEFPVPPPFVSITAGPDGNLWFGARPWIVRMSPHGEVKQFALPKDSLEPALIVGPDGNLWFSEGQGVGKIAKMTLAGQITEFSLPFEMIAPASDGNLWVMGNGVIGRITPDGVLMSKFAVATDKIGALTAGPDGNLWFLETDGHVGRITLAGEVKRFAAFEPTSPQSDSSLIIVGPDGNLWFSAGVGKIGRITPSGTVTLLPLPPKAQVGALAAGPDGGIWFIRSDTDIMSGLYWWVQIGRITP